MVFALEQTPESRSRTSPVDGFFEETLKILGLYRMKRA